MLFLELLVNGFFAGIPIAIAALGFALIWYTSKEFHFLYGTMLAASGFGVYSLANAGVSLVAAFVIVIAVAAAAGAVLEHVFYRRLGSPLTILLFSFGLAIVLQNVLQIIYGPSDSVLKTAISRAAVDVLPGTDITRQGNDILALGALIVVWIATWATMSRTDFGLALQSVMTDPEAARYVGVPAARIRWIAYAFGSGLGALSGALSMLGNGVRPTTGFDVMLFAFMATFLAGGIVARVPLWGLLIGVALSLVAWKLPANFNTLIVFCLMLAYVITRRRLDEIRLRLRELRQARPPAPVEGAVR